MATAADPNAIQTDQSDPALAQKKPAVAATPAAPASGINLSGVQPTDQSGQLPAAPLATTDPMAFAPAGGSGAPPAAAGAGSTLAQSPGATPAGSTAPDWQSYSPMSGLTEQQKQEYCAGQGVPVSGAYNASYGQQGQPAAGTADPSKLAALSAAGAADPAVAGVQANQAATKAAVNANNVQSLFGEAQGQAQNAVSGLPISATGGVQDYYNTTLKNSGFNPDGTQTTTGANPNAISGPAPTQTGTAPQSNGGSGWVNPATGQWEALGGGPTVNYANGQATDASGNPTSPAAGQPGATTGTPGSAGGMALPSSATTGTPPGATTGAPTGATTGTGNGAANNGGVGLSAIDPNNSLINQTITPNNSVDRVATNNAALQSTIDNVLNPAFAANSRTIAANSFGAGRGVSGMNRTAQGNLAQSEDQQIADLTKQSNANAVTGSIQDMYNNVGQADQQQQFQAGQQSNAFNQNVTQNQLQDSLTNSAFGRAQAQNAAGQANSPADISLILSQLFGGQATQAGNAASGLFQQQGTQAGVNGGTTGTPSGTDIASILAALGIGQGNQNPQTALPANIPTTYPGVQGGTTGG